MYPETARLLDEHSTLKGSLITKAHPASLEKNADCDSIWQITATAKCRPFTRACATTEDYVLQEEYGDDRV